MPDLLKTVQFDATALENKTELGWTGPHVERFIAHCHRRHYPPRHIIIKAGDKPDVLYFILDGSVTVLMETADGHEIVLDYLNRGAFFGEMGLFGDGGRRSAWVRTRTDCILAEIGYAKFRQVAAQDPEVLFAILGQMAQRLRRTNRKVADLAFLDVTGRIARTLLDLCEQPEAMTHPEGMLIRITRQELAHLVGCSREMAGRVLKELEEQGLITTDGKTIVVFGWRRD